MKNGRASTMTHDDKRPVSFATSLAGDRAELEGTTTLLAALNLLEGTVTGRSMARHRHRERIRCLNALERAIPAGKIVHAILDNVASHKTPEVRRWLARHPCWTFHFTPTSSSPRPSF